MDVKSEKTFEDIVERLSALFKVEPASREPEYEKTMGADPVSPLDAPAAHNGPLDSIEEK